MSAYGKTQPQQLHGYDAARGYSDNTFSYAAPTYGSQPPASAATTAPVFHHAPQLTPMPYTSNQVRASYDEHTGPYLNVGVANFEITSYSPHRGTRDTKFYVYITSLYELMTEDSTPHFSLMFGRRKCQASLQKMSQQGAVCSYSVATDIPSYSSTGWTSSASVPIYMWTESGDGDLIEKQEVGNFTYLDAQSATNAPLGASRKRKLSSDSTELMRSPSKRLSGQQIRPKDEYSTYGYAQSEATPAYTPYLQQSNNYTNLVPQYSRSAGNYHGQQPSRHLAYGYSTSAAASPPSIKAPSPQAGNWYSSGSMARSPGVQSSSASRPPLSSLPTPQAMPALVRTSTIQQTPSPATTPHGGTHFNVYGGIYKAKLEVHGNLDDMVSGWSDEEWESRRRLVHFRRTLTGSTITTTFHPVTLEDRPPNTPTSATISCIYWEEKNECFVTSVDMIYLLGKLVENKFTVEEKNRIRRNLEGFRPLTVSKGKPDSEEFFKVIMGFPTPKPRNIEKDVKVFQWKDLSTALKKIIGKYSATPASVLPPSLTPVSSTGYATEGSSAGLSYPNDHHGGISPRSISNSTSSTYTSNISARALSPRDHKPMILPGGITHHPHDAPSHWPTGQHHMQSHSYQPLSAHSTRDAWGMYLENGTATTSGTSAPSQNPNLHYPNPRINTDSAASGSNNGIVRSLSQQQQHAHAPGQPMPRT